MNRKITAALTVLILVLAAAIVAAPQNARLVDTSTGQVVTNSNLFVESSDNVVNAVVAVETARLDGEDATAGDTAGSDLLIAAGQGTGSADSGDIEFEVAITDEGTSTTLKTREAVARFEGLTGWLSLLKPLEMLEEASTPSNPSTDSWLLYFQDDGLYYLEDDGTEVGPLISASGAVTDHGALTGLSDDDHPGHPWLAGRVGGQTLDGGTGASDNLTLSSSSNASPTGHVVIERGALTSADSTFTGTEMLGLNAVASGDDAVVIGQSANVGPNGVVIGQGAAGGDGAVVIGQGAGNSGIQDAVIIGLTAIGTDGAIALGLNADGSGGNIAIGSGAVADGISSIAIGGGADAGHDGSIAIGSSDIATTTAANQLVIKGITTAYLGDGVTDTSPNSMSVYGTGGSGANVQGADLTLAAGAGTGDAACGRFYIDYAPAGATGSTLNGYAQAFEIETDGDTRIYNDLQVDGNATVTGWVYPGDGVEIDTAAILSFNNGTHAAEAYPTGTELLIDATGATMNSIGINDLDVVVKTGSVSVTAGDITATAGDVLVTAGGVGIGSGAPSAKLHVDNGGTTPSLSARTVLLLQDNVAASDSVGASLVSGTSGYSTILFGDSGQESAGLLRYYNLNDEFQMRAGGSGIDWIMSAAGAVDQEGGLTAGNASNTRWASVPIVPGVGASASLTANSSGLLWSVGAATAGDILFPVPSSVLGTEIKAVRVYYTTTAYSTPGSTINVGLYEANAGTNGLVTGASNSAAITSATSATLTATATGVQSLGAGDQATVRVWISPSAGDVVIQITSVEVQYEEREY